MEQATKKKLLVGGALLVVAGVGGYFLYKYFKNKSEKKRLEEEQKKLQEQQQQKPPTAPSGGGSKNYGPFVDSDGVKMFQDWMDKNHPNWVNGKNLNKGSGYGNFGPSTSKAWDKYGTEYSKPSTVTPAPAPAPVPVALKVGDKVAMSKPDFWWKTNAYQSWDYVKGVNGSIVSTNGKAPAGLYTGVVTNIPAVGDLITVDNFQNQPSDSWAGGGDTSTFRVDKKSVVKIPEAASFDGMTVEYIGSTI
jgi:hypothetical protein